MKFATLLLIPFGLVLSACNTPTVSGYGAGSDAAYLNATRGRSDAQISSVQAEQYARQQDMVSREMDLEQKKQRGFWNNVQGVSNVVGTVLR